MSTRVSRPYAKVKGGPPSITTVLQAMSKEGLRWGAVRETAIFAVTRRDEWEDLAEAEAITRLAAHHDVKWGGAKAMGTLVHSVNEAWIAGEEVDVAGLIDAEANPPKTAKGYQPVGVKAWKGREHLVLADANGYIDGLERFWRDFLPETTSTEEVVRHMRGPKAFYTGTRDWIAVVDGKPTLIEIKTSSRAPDPDKPGDRLYLEDWRLQLAAQRCASHVVDYDDEGNETGSRPNQRVDRCAVLHLTGDGRYGFWEVQAALDEQAIFLRLVDIYHWWVAGHKTPPALDLKPVLVMEAAS